MTTDTYITDSITGKSTIQKDPAATLDYTFDWSDYLALIADTIASVTFTVAGGVALTTQSNTTTAATAWISGGVTGVPASVACRITTSSGRTDERTIYLKIKDR